jgi:hypothetical protein
MPNWWIKGVEVLFFYQFALGGRNLRAVNANENKKKKRFDLFQKIYFHGATTTTRRWKAAELLAIEIASLGVNNLKIVTKVGL